MPPTKVLSEDRASTSELPAAGFVAKAVEAIGQIAGNKEGFSLRNIELYYRDCHHGKAGECGMGCRRWTDAEIFEKLYDSFPGTVLELDFSKLETFESRHPG